VNTLNHLDCFLEAYAKMTFMIITILMRSP